MFEKAIRELAQNWKIVLSASLIPLLCSSLIQVAGVVYFQSNVTSVDSDQVALYSFISLGFFVASTPFFVLFATNCHRIILLGANSLPNRFGLYWSNDQTRFLGWVIGLGIIATVVSIPFYIAPAILVSFDVQVIPIWVSGYLGTLTSTYFEGRLGLVLPATAVGSRMALRESWHRTRRIGWAIFFALVIPLAITEVIDYVVFSRLIASDSPAIYFLGMVTFYPLIAIGVAILTIVYRDTGPSPSDP